jgi:EAL domain-containing protein (putative c-di-GMP-specific phosphodiesterase class I)
MSCDITDILSHKSLAAYFQPVVSINEKKISGLEGLIRGISPDSAEIILPLYLFSAAESRGLETELDRACRETVIDAFKSINRDDILLFLNLHSSILDKTAGSNHLVNTVRRSGIDPQNIVIEINESRVRETSLLKAFVEKYRKEGFLIALDDVGCGFSNMDRISLTRPDIVKIDISLVRNICTDFYVREVFHALVNLSTKIGALVVAEGVETEEEAIETLELGANMIQGYCISKPQKAKDLSTTPFEEKIEHIAKRFRASEKKKLLQSKNNYSKLNSIANDFASNLETVSAEDFDETLVKIVERSSIVECLYILDEDGIQSSNTVFNCAMKDTRHNKLFSPAKKGADHSMKNYYCYMKNAGLRKYITEPYESLASGNLCMTFARVFQDKHKMHYILCLDFKVDDRKDTLLH